MAVKKEELHIKGLYILQDKSKFCYGLDAVLLSDFVKVKNNSLCADLGTGNGIIPILMAAQNQTLKIDGFEIQKEIYELACLSVEINSFQNRISFFNEDIKNCATSDRKNQYDVVTSNPPYFPVIDYDNLNVEDSRIIARHEVLCSLENVMKCAYDLLKPSGKFFMVHRANRFAEIISLCIKCRMDIICTRFIHPDVEKNATMVLVELKKGKGSVENLNILKPLFVYDENGNYTCDIDKIYKRK